MLRSLVLKNFRGFREHRVEFAKEAILIGRNNAGKTTIIEALRILSVCQMRAKTTGFSACPEWLAEHCSGAGFKPSLETIDFDYSNVQHAYDKDEPAVIKARLANGNEIGIYIGNDPSEVFCQLRKGGKEAAYDRASANRTNYGSTKVMPPIGSLLPREKSIAKDRLSRYLDGYLAYRHFRNQLWERPSDYRLFERLLEETWTGVKINHFENNHGDGGNEFSLLIREGRFTSEISWHGHGLQAWLQTIWFLARTHRSSTIVLDEPDVYLHADLQRKLIKTIESLKFRQTILATHSSEIISDVPFQNVIVVQKRDPVSRAAKNAAAIQDSLRNMGSIHSIQLSKLANRGILLLVEGKDRPFLGEIAYKMGPKVFDVFSEIAVQEIEGSGNWNRALGASSAMYKASAGDVKVQLLLDSDYFTSESHEDKKKKGREHHLEIKFWRRKEIENYFLIPEAIARYINDECGGSDETSPAEMRDLIDQVVDDLKQETIESIAEGIRISNKGYAIKTAMDKARERISSLESDGLTLKDLVSGKRAFSILSGLSQEKFGVSFNALSICKEARLDEVSSEMPEFLATVCARRD